MPPASVALSCGTLRTRGTRYCATCKYQAGRGAGRGQLVGRLSLGRLGLLRQAVGKGAGGRRVPPLSPACPSHDSPG